MKIEKNIMIICFFILGMTLCQAKSTEPKIEKEVVVGLYSFDYLRSVDKLFPITISGHIAEKLACFNNIELLDKSNFPTIGEVHDDAKSYMSASAETVEQGRIKGAEKLVTGLVAAVEKEYIPTAKTFKISIIMDVSIIDVESGISEETKQFIFEGVNNIAYALKALGINDPGKLSTEDVLDLLGERGELKAIKKSFKSLDNELFPFLGKYFGEFSKDCGDGGKSGFSIPTEFLKIDRTEVFKITKRHSESTLLIDSNGKNQWKKRLTNFDIMTEIEEEDLEGNIITREVRLESVSFKGYSGKYAILEFRKKTAISVDEIVSAIKDGENIYVKRKQKKQAKN